MHSPSQRRLSPPANPPTHQRFRSIEDPDHDDSIVSLLIHVLDTAERVVYWSDILQFFPQAHMIINGNALVSPVRHGLSYVIPIRIEANSAAIYIVVMQGQNPPPLNQ
ncbi:hypothetical protein BGX23_009854 [Mortierella sp. AD031]|nr:hypothetical protein BGX23_009854 [Mortierella sp. AD031]KAG0216565.1 hypothetical protein BGX33_012504 [Mortierella sp. NVP41]